MQAGEKKIYSERGEKDGYKTDHGQPGNTAAAPGPGKPGMQGGDIDKPGDDRSGFPGIPTPVGSPGLICPDSSGDNACRQPHETKDNGFVGEVVPFVKKNRVELVLLDLMLPGRDGLEVCKDIRSFFSLPIIMVTARVEGIDRLLGLELGADDYLCKPYLPREVGRSRSRAGLRRAGGGADDIPSRGLNMDEERHRASLHGHDLELTAVEFKLLSYLVASPWQDIFQRSVDGADLPGSTHCKRPHH